MILFLGLLLLAVLLVVAGESGFTFVTLEPSSVQTAFLCQSLMEIATVILIPLALRLFKFRRVHQALATDGVKGLWKWGQVRIFMLCVPLILNVVFYYATMSAAFGYMAIILFLCLFFIVPTKGRCEDEVEKAAEK